MMGSFLKKRIRDRNKFKFEIVDFYVTSKFTRFV